MEKRTLLLFAVMLTLFAFYLAMTLRTMPEVSSDLKAQTELLNSLDQEVSAKPAHN